MPSYLGIYPGCANNREEKFIRAVDSFLYQEYENRELIIISDGCDITEKIYIEKYSTNDNIIFFKIEKDVLFSGTTRNKGLELATGDLICYLDTDDFFSKKHLSKIMEQVSNYDWYFSDDRLIKHFKSIEEYDYVVRVNEIQINKIGTSSIIHKNFEDIRWQGGYAHDWKFIEDLFNRSKLYRKIEAEYNVCHIPNMIDV